MAHKIFAIVKNEFVLLMHKPKIILIILSILFMIDSVAKPMKDLSLELGYKLNIIEPFIFITSKGLNLIIIPLIFIAILSDYPLSSGNTDYYYIIRSGRIIWFWGETLFALICSITYILILFLSIAIYCSDNSFLGNYWSDYTLKTYIDYPDIFLYGTMFLDTSVYTQGKPVEILLLTLSLLIMYIFILIMIILLFKIIGKKSFGMIFTIGITFVGLPAYATTSQIRWIFPITHTAYNWHFNEFFSKPYCNISTSYIYFSILIIILVTINLNLVKKSQIGEINS